MDKRINSSINGHQHIYDFTASHKDMVEHGFRLLDIAILE